MAGPVIREDLSIAARLPLDSARIDDVGAARLREDKRRSCVDSNVDVCRWDRRWSVMVEECENLGCGGMSVEFARR